MKKNKLFRILKAVGLGFLNGNPITAAFTPSIQTLTEVDKDADLDENGKIGTVKQNNVNVYYITSFLGVFLGIAATIFVCFWGIKQGLTQEQIEFILNKIDG